MVAAAVVEVAAGVESGAGEREEGEERAGQRGGERVARGARHGGGRCHVGASRPRLREVARGTARHSWPS